MAEQPHHCQDVHLSPHARPGVESEGQVGRASFLRAMSTPLSKRQVFNPILPDLPEVLAPPAIFPDT